MEVRPHKPLEVGQESGQDDLRHAQEAASGSPYLSCKQAARYLGLDYRSLQNMRQRGAGPRFVRVGRQVRYHIRDIRAYARAPGVRGEARG